MTSARETKAASRSGALPKSSARDPLMVNSVEKAFRVLHVFDGLRSSLSLSEVAEEAGLDISATQRFVHTLQKLGYLEKNLSTKRLQLTMKCLEIGHAYVRGSNLIKQALPFLLHLNKETEETVNLTLLDGTDIVFVARFLSRHIFNTDVVIGSRLPAYCTAPGRAIMSCMPKAQAQALIKQSVLEAHTPNTPVTPAEVWKRVAQAKERGYASQAEEYFRGDISLAAPIRGHDGLALGAINLAASPSRYTVEELEARFAQNVMAAAHAVAAPSR